MNTKVILVAIASIFGSFALSASSSPNCLRITFKDSKHTTVEHYISPAELTYSNDGSAVIVNIEGNQVSYKLADINQMEFFEGTPKVTLTDSEDFEYTNGLSGVDVEYNRTLPADWGTLVLPFSLKQGDVDGVVFHKVDKVEETEGVSTLYTAPYADGEEIAAYTPVIFKGTKDASLAPSAQNIDIPAAPGPITDNNQTEITMVGTMKAVENVATDSNKSYFYINNNKFWHATGTLKTAPFRAWLEANKNDIHSISFVIVPSTTPTKVEAIFEADGSASAIEGIYDLNGRRLPELQQGVNIVRKANGETLKIYHK